jgi:hypothetical protein
VEADIGLLAVVLEKKEILVEALAVLLLVVEEIINQELQILVEVVAEEVLQHLLVVALMQVPVVPVSSSSLILHKYSKNIKWA